MIVGRCAKIMMCSMLFAHSSILLGDAMSDCARIFESEIRDGVVHGAAVVAGSLDGEPLTGAWGWADAAHTMPMTTRTVVDVASVTKVAAGATAYLVEHAKGRVDFDAPFTNYLESYTAPLARKVTIRDLANHVSGFGEADGSPRVYFSPDAKTMLRNVLSMPPGEPMTGKVVYSCRNYVLLGQAFESVAGGSMPPPNWRKDCAVPRCSILGGAGRRCCSTSGGGAMPLFSQRVAVTTAVPRKTDSRRLPH